MIEHDVATMSGPLERGALVALAVVGLLAGCTPADSATATAVRESLPNGATLVRYGALPATVRDTLVPEITIGVMDGEDHEIFGDIRGIEADAAGRIYVFDAQTADIRVFGPDGDFLRRISRRGEGPGEIGSANGMMFGPDGILWVQDHAKWKMLGFGPDGNEVARADMPVRSYGYMYSGIVDDRGRFWKTTSHAEEDQVFPPPTGLVEGEARFFAVVHDPATAATDSVFLAEVGFRTHIAQTGSGGYSYWGLPFENRLMTAFDPAGGLWLATGETYRVVRVDERGDTALVLEAATDPLPVTDSDRAAWVETMSQDDPARRRVAEEVVAMASDTRPVFDRILVDDDSRLWVRRTSEGDAPRRWDVFTREGDHAGSVVLDFAASPYFPHRVRNGRLYTFTLDELEVPRVVVMTLPPLAASTD